MITKTRTGYIITVNDQNITVTKLAIRNGQHYDVFAGDTHLGRIFCRPNGASWWSTKPGQKTLGLPTDFVSAVTALTN